MHFGDDNDDDIWNDIGKRVVDQAIAGNEPDEDALKELADIVFVCFQYATAAGWELDEALDRVFKSNMSKLENGKPVKNAAGKVIKGRNYKPPYLEDIV